MRKQIQLISLFIFTIFIVSSCKISKNAQRAKPAYNVSKNSPKVPNKKSTSTSKRTALKNPLKRKATYTKLTKSLKQQRVA